MSEKTNVKYCLLSIIFQRFGKRIDWSIASLGGKEIMKHSMNLISSKYSYEFLRTILILLFRSWLKYSDIEQYPSIYLIPNPNIYLYKLTTLNVYFRSAVYFWVTSKHISCFTKTFYLFLQCSMQFEQTYFEGRLAQYYPAMESGQFWPYG